MNLTFIVRALLLVSLLMLSHLAGAQCTYFNDFVDNQDGTVTDPRSNTIWQRCALGMAWNGSTCRGQGIEVGWGEAITLARQNKFLSQSDWRLPTADEFKAVLGTYSQCQKNNWTSGVYSASSLIAIPVKPPYAGDYWSSTVINSNPIEIVTADFIFGHITSRDLDKYSAVNNVRLVRAGTDENQRVAAEGMRQADIRNRLERERKDIEIRMQAEADRKKAELAREEAARQKRAADNERTVQNLQAKLACEEATRFASSRPENERPYFDTESCLSERRFQSILKSKDSQAMYLAGVRYESSNEQGRAKSIYENIMDRFSSTAMAVKAADRLASLKDVQTIESSNRRREEAATREAARKAEGPCSNVYPGKVGTLRGPSSLSIDVRYVVRYVNAEKGTASVEATSSGQLNMNRGEMKEISCRDL